MSVPVELDALRSEAERFGTAPYLLTVSDDLRPHCVAVAVIWRAGELTVAAGNRTVANAAARPEVSLLWCPPEAGGHSLIADATVIATAATGRGDNSITLRPTHAVLHRPAADPATATDPAAAGGCGSDCVSLADP